MQGLKRYSKQLMLQSYPPDDADEEADPEVLDESELDEPEADPPVPPEADPADEPDDSAGLTVSHVLHDASSKAVVTARDKSFIVCNSPFGLCVALAW